MTGPLAPVTVTWLEKVGVPLTFTVAVVGELCTRTPTPTVMVKVPTSPSVSLVVPLAMYEPGASCPLVVTAPEERSQEAEKPIAMARPMVSSAELVAERLRSEALPVNANYTIAYGRNSEDLQPAMVFDDGRFTYIKWPGNREIPAIFEIRTDGSEMVANTRMQGEFIVVDRIARGLMLRSGSAVTSIKNESFESEGLAPVGGTAVPGVERAMRE